jgi:hypothetical protein
MTTTIYQGRTKWAGKEDKDGHRDYAIEFLVRSDSKDDGPFTVRNTAGLPLPGAAWVFGNDNDPFAYCTRESEIEPVQQRQEATDLWRARFTFTTKPYKRCQDEKFENPLLEPPRKSGTFTKFKEEMANDRFNIPLRYSSHERMKGPQTEFDKGLPTVNIEMNVLTLDLALMGVLLHTVNGEAMWGLPPRCVKLSGITWSEEFYGLCFPYYKIRYEFEINADTFDREVADEGHKVLMGRWEKPGVWRIVCVDGDVPDRHNPAHFMPFKFPDGTTGPVQLNGKGLPAGVVVVWDECAGQTIRGKMLGCPGEADSDMESLLTTGGAIPFTNYYVSIYNNVPGTLAGLQDDEVWLNVPLTTTPLTWSAYTVYRRGQMVRHNAGAFGDTVWICLRDSRGAEPGDFHFPAQGTGTSAGIYVDNYDQFWLLLGNPDITGTAAYVPNPRGVFDPCVTYNLGDMVQEAPDGVATGTGTAATVAGGDKTRQGKIHVEYYPEGNHFLLGIPATL